MQVYVYTENCREAGEICYGPTPEQLRADVVLAYSGTREEITTEALADYCRARNSIHAETYLRNKALSALEECGLDTTLPLTLHELHDWVKNMEREYAPGSETSLYGAYQEDIRKHYGVLPIDDVEDIPLSPETVHCWIAAYEDYDPTPESPCRA